MKQLQSHEVRQMFLDFFKEKKHGVEPSRSLVPQDDPTLLWINSGVATLKKYFDGRIVPDNPRIVNAQKSIRTNDIENVGFTARHHTFFEMLGNFSIGDYFKEEAIEWAWEFLTSDHWIGFDEDKLAVTVHPEDEEAYDIWLNKVGVPAERIIRIEENFWDIGEGPSGPNTEIFYDRGESYGNDLNDPELYPGGENERYLEIWNLVFSQFNHNPDDTYSPLPKKNIDTGMGLERIVSVIQDTKTNFETDLFKPIIERTEKISNVTYGQSIRQDTAFKVIADHVRTVAFAIGDGALPSNEGRGYVLRRLLRRAIRFAKDLNINEPFMYQLVDEVASIMFEFYPEVHEKKDFIKDVMKKEEQRFHETLQEGLAILEKVMKSEKEKGSNVFPGEEVFTLYDTYGFPKELTEEYIEAEGFSIDEPGFEKEMKKQRDRAREARQKVDSMQVQDQVLQQIHTKSEFIGFEKLAVDTTLDVIVKDSEMIDEAQTGDVATLVLAQTPFYAESGGQIADKGIITTETGKASVMDVQKGPNGQNLHQVDVIEGTLKSGQSVSTEVTRYERQQVIKNHTATHLLHQALKDVLGDHVNQAGSLVAPDRLRFDFTHFNAVSEEELQQIETIVNEKVWASIPVAIMHKTLDEAKQMGAMALFDAKYGEEVRVVAVDDYSIELCGGCHVGNTAEIGLFKVTQETGIGAGTRRIEACTGPGAYEYYQGREQLLNDAAHKLKTKTEQVPQRIDTLFQEMKDLQKETESLSAKLANVESANILDEVEIIDGVNLLAQKVDVSDMNALRNMVDELKQKVDSGIILLAMENGDKVQLASGVSKDLVDRGFHAGHVIKEAATRCGGGGGGRPDMAQAGGKQPEKIDEALASAKDYIKTVLTS
ncbi:alanine--tRNA ligase [Alkalibacillus haloalkaliphilus]|uniref:alanine--tRNA ligase n=1 Tax=Alkalibacillus haloalkaliphilus TaxID=94136 RepID=UPI0029356935|nr:alanine--tRNA ligase [Alkalibacillus haloalkaliphilus]MDV2581078.1 alanine--tRNA ligase [Alkalibacillus haloalkaliphilus]